ncbi:MAG TPA: ATP-dependent Clp protease proteolytic subunit [Acidimicrobiales bacterium]|nr:ATP-dependent Clp protease proteolytic subunit [Acidimicrobiales bacterium]
METPRPEFGDWLEGFLFDRRIAVVRGPLDDPAATRVATELMTLDATGDSAVTLQIDSPGGPLSSAFALVDVIEMLGVPVKAVCLGRLEGTAVAVAAVCSHRLALPHTQFRFCDPEVAFEAPASQVKHTVSSHLAMVRRFHEVLARSSGTPLEEVERWCAEGRYLTAEEAHRAGLVDEVAQRPAPLRRVR